MKTFKFSVLCAAALSLCAATSAQATDYTPVSVNLVATYVIDQIPYATAINNTTLLKKIGAYLNFSPVGDTLQIDNTTGDLCVLNSSGALVANLGTGIGGTNVVTDVNGISFRVQANPFFNGGGAVEVTGGSSTLPNFNVKGSFTLPFFSIRFQDDLGNTPGDFSDDYRLLIDSGYGTFAESLTVTGAVNAYKQSINCNVYGFVDNDIAGWFGTVTGTITASGKSAVAAPSIWDVITPIAVP